MALTLILASLIVYRLATDLALMDGPFGAYAKMRGWVATRSWLPWWVQDGVICPVCWSFWMALPAGLALDLSVMGLVYWLAIAGAVALAVRITP